MGLKCSFYETTGSTRCPFHTLLFKTYDAGNEIGVKLVKVVKKPKPKRRKYGKR